MASKQFICAFSFSARGLKANEHFFSQVKEAMLKSVTIAVR